ncbi:MAG: hypothetical protein JWQ27_911 [Ferruginibacter sp.]|nr:hypothetical protein [Ferruginibacter sp.]
MKKLLFSLSALVLTTVAFAQKKAEDVAKFKTETIEMGKLEVSHPQTAVFTVTNVSNEPLIIEQANPTCGCTIGNYTKEPIAPGKTGEITATYNAGSVGAFEKHMTVKFAGVDEMKSITIKGEVLTADEYAKLKPATPTSTVETKVKTKAPKAAGKTKTTKTKVKTTTTATTAKM